MEVEEKHDALAALYEEWSGCQKCSLCTRRHNVVFGAGNPDANVVIIGGAPDLDSDINASPFAGRTGEIIDMFLEDLESDRDEVFIFDVVGCIPIDERDPQKDRQPTAAELAACRPRVDRILEIIDPYVVILLGSLPFKELSTAKGAIKPYIHDKDQKSVPVVSGGRLAPIDRVGFVTYHPRYLQYNWDTKEHGCVHASLSTWTKAFRVADTYAELYKGITPPSRGQE